MHFARISFTFLKARLLEIFYVLRKSFVDFLLPSSVPPDKGNDKQKKRGNNLILTTALR